MPAPNFRISRRAVIWTVSVALLYLLVGFLLLPMLARPMLADALHDKLQRPVTIGALKFNPLTLAATVQQLSIGEKDPAQPPLLQVGTAHLNLQAWSIWGAGASHQGSPAGRAETESGAQCRFELQLR